MHPDALVSIFRQRSIVNIVVRTTPSGLSYTPITPSGRDIGLGLTRRTFLDLQSRGLVASTGDPFGPNGTLYEVLLP